MEKINSQDALKSYFSGFYTKCASLGIHPDAVLQGNTLQNITPEVLTCEVLEPIVKAASAHGVTFEKIAQAQAAPTGGGFWNSMAQPFKDVYNQGADAVSNGNVLGMGQTLLNGAVSPVRSLMGGAAEGTKDIPGLSQITNVANNATNGVLDTANSAVGADINGTIGNATNTATRAVQDTVNAPLSAIKQTMGKDPAVAGNTRTLAPAAKPGTAMAPVVAQGQTPSFGAPKMDAAGAKPYAQPAGPTPTPKAPKPFLAPKPAPSTPAAPTPISKGNAPAPAAPAPAPAAPAAPKTPDNSAQGGVPLNQLTGAARMQRLAELSGKAKTNTNNIQQGHLMSHGIEGKPGELTGKGMMQTGMNMLPGGNSLANAAFGTGPTGGAQTNMDALHGAKGSTNIGEQAQQAVNVGQQGAQAIGQGAKAVGNAALDATDWATGKAQQFGDYAKANPANAAVSMLAPGLGAATGGMPLQKGTQMVAGGLQNAGNWLSNLAK